jgi:dihydrofolate reductase
MAPSAPPKPTSTKLSVFIATSLDGYIARPDGGLDWLVDPSELPGDAGYGAFMADVDTVVLGRATYDTVVALGHWGYADKPVVVISSTLAADTDERITVVRDLDALFAHLEATGATRAYVDGGKLIQSLLAIGAVDDLTISVAPVLLGAGLPLFGPLRADIHLRPERTEDVGAGLIQTVYTVLRD